MSFLSGLLSSFVSSSLFLGSFCKLFDIGFSSCLEFSLLLACFLLGLRNLSFGSFSVSYTLCVELYHSLSRGFLSSFSGGFMLICSSEPFFIESSLGLESLLLLFDLLSLVFCCLESFLSLCSCCLCCLNFFLRLCQFLLFLSLQLFMAGFFLSELCSSLFFSESLFFSFFCFSVCFKLFLGRCGFFLSYSSILLCLQFSLSFCFGFFFCLPLGFGFSFLLLFKLSGFLLCGQGGFSLLLFLKLSYGFLN